MKYRSALVGMLMMGLFATGCVAEPEDAGDTGDTEEPALSETSSELTLGAHYCVDQSYASAERIGTGYVDTCWRSPIWSTTLSNGHMVTAITNCGGFSSAYAIVWSHWNSAYYYMRQDALRRC
jgi:hypothetical protein